VLAQFIGVTVTPTGGGLYDIVLDFQTAGGTDITWTDPADGNSVMLSASWTSGTFNSSPTPGLQVISTYCDGVGGCGPAGLTGDPLAIGFALIDNLSLYAGLFDSDGNPLTNNSVMLDFSELFDFSPDINTIAAYVIANNDLPDFTGEGEGQLYRVDTGEFVIPEPSTALLFGLGIAGLGMVRRRNQL
jgi:PEP-CTERM motif-containing protein